jgi:crotonobetainyl-CoA:carnitine CoA-transferase CaiB-like acyl-CoA transferase
VYPAKDGFIYMAIGSDVQWKRLTELPRFTSVANPVRVTNEGRHKEREAIYRDIGLVTARYSIEEIAADLKRATIPNAQINDIRQVIDLAQLRDKLTTTVMPSGKTVRMQPLAVDRDDARTRLHFPHKYGEDTRAVLAEAGFQKAEIDALASSGVIPG